MSFLDTYVKKYRLDKLSSGTKKNLVKLETQLDKVTKKAAKGVSFLDSIKDHANTISDLIERVAKHFDGWKLGLTTVLPSLRFVISIATEVYQIVEQMHDSIVQSGMTKEQQSEAKLAFGKDLVWFVWTTVGPFDKVLTWLPFRKTIEKKLVHWIAGMGLEAALDLFSANSQDVSSFSSNMVHMKAL